MNSTRTKTLHRVNRMVFMLVCLYAILGALVGASLLWTDGVTLPLLVHVLLFVGIPIAGLGLKSRADHGGDVLLFVLYLGLLLRPVTGVAGLGIHPSLTISLPLAVPGLGLYLIDVFALLIASLCGVSLWHTHKALRP